MQFHKLHYYTITPLARVIELAMRESFLVYVVTFIAFFAFMMTTPGLSVASNLIHECQLRLWS